MIGTVAYMSPEQLRGKAVDHRSDIFSFGAILYEMMSGSRAFRGETEVDTMTAVLREEPAIANLEEAAIPPGYQDIVKHCLEKDPENRFQSAKDLVFALQTLAVFAGRELLAPKAKTHCSDASLGAGRRHWPHWRLFWRITQLRYALPRLPLTAV